jgi:hypothetical protein
MIQDNRQENTMLILLVAVSLWVHTSLHADEYVNEHKVVPYEKYYGLVNCRIIKWLQMLLEEKPAVKDASR